MLDINLIREKPDYVREGMVKVGAEPALIDKVLRLDECWRGLVAEGEKLRAQQKAKSKGKVTPEQAKALRELGEQSKKKMAEADKVRAELDELMLNIPNVPHPDVPVGKDETENVVRRTEGELPKFDFEPKPHWELGPALGILDFDRGVKMSGTRFYVLMRDGARLQRALISYMLDLHTKTHGYTEVYPPYLVGARCLVGTGNLPKFADNLYHDAEEDYWLIPTAEVPLTNLHREEKLAETDLPKHYVAYTACFRREKMKAGADVRGIKRGHQFDKVELMKYTTPEHSDKELEKLIEDACDVCRGLRLPFRIVEMCTGDLSFVAMRKFDIEVWAAGCKEWLEASSCSNMGDFQARRANIRFRPERTTSRPQKVGTGQHVRVHLGAPEFVHTLNGSGLALPRTLIAVLENYQQADGSVVVPEVLRPYMDGLERIERP